MQATSWRDFEGKTVDGKYYLQRLIGTGSFGAVFVADEVVADRLIRQVAVKLIEPEAADTEAQFAELIAAANLDHPALLRCIAPGQAELDVAGDVEVREEGAGVAGRPSGERTAGSGGSAGTG